MTNQKWMQGEPWYPSESADFFENWTKEDTISANQVRRQKDKNEFYERAFDFLTDNEIIGDYLEFGCHRARTFRMALSQARRQDFRDMRFMAFDSFRGLPPGDDQKHSEMREKWEVGALSTSVDEFSQMIKSHGLFMEKIEIVEGFYSETLTENLALQLFRSDQKGALITVDCDYHDSATIVFPWIDKILQCGCVLYLDDYWSGNKGDPRYGVAGAFDTYRTDASWLFVDYLNVGAHGRAFITIERRN